MKRKLLHQPMAMAVAVVMLLAIGPAWAEALQINCTMVGSTMRLMPLQGSATIREIPVNRAELFYRSDSGGVGFSGDTHYECAAPAGQALAAGSLSFTSLGQNATQKSGPPAANSITVRLGDATLIGASNGWPYPPRGGTVTIPVDFMGAAPGPSFRVTLGSNLQKQTPPGIMWDLKPSSSLTIAVESAVQVDPLTQLIELLRSDPQLLALFLEIAGIR